MEQVHEKTYLDREKILHEVIQMVEHTISDWDLDFTGGVKADTRLIADLAYESLDVVQFVVAIQERFMRRDLPFEELLMTEGRYVDDLRVEEVVDFLHEHLNA